MASRGAMLLGQCMPCIKKNASKIRIRHMELDKNLNMVSTIGCILAAKYGKVFCVFCSISKRMNTSLLMIPIKFVKLAILC